MILIYVAGSSLAELEINPLPFQTRTVCLESDDIVNMNWWKREKQEFHFTLSV